MVSSIVAMEEVGNRPNVSTITTSAIISFGGEGLGSHVVKLSKTNDNTYNVNHAVQDVLVACDGIQLLSKTDKDKSFLIEFNKNDLVKSLKDLNSSDCYLCFQHEDANVSLSLDAQNIKKITGNKNDSVILRSMQEKRFNNERAIVVQGDTRLTPPDIIGLGICGIAALIYLYKIYAVFGC